VRDGSQYDQECAWIETNRAVVGRAYEVCIETGEWQKMHAL
jgi:hypothetical protein